MILVARRSERLKDLSAELEAEHKAKSLVLPCDLANRELLDQLMGGTDDFLARDRVLTILVNNAGTGYWDYFGEQSASDVQRDIDLNVSALTTLCHAFVEKVREHGQPARILNISSLTALLATPRYAVYSATKAYVLRFSEILSYEFKKKKLKISICCSCPGGVLTEFMGQSGQELKGEVGMMTSKDVAESSVAAALSGKKVYVPGAMNKLSALARFLPSQLGMAAVERSMLITVKDK